MEDSTEFVSILFDHLIYNTDFLMEPNRVGGREDVKKSQEANDDMLKLLSGSIPLKIRDCSKETQAVLYYVYSGQYYKNKEVIRNHGSVQLEFEDHTGTRSFWLSHGTCHECQSIDIITVDDGMFLCHRCMTDYLCMTYPNLLHADQVMMQTLMIYRYAAYSFFHKTITNHMRWYAQKYQKYTENQCNICFVQSSDLFTDTTTCCKAGYICVECCIQTHDKPCPFCRHAPYKECISFASSTPLHRMNIYSTLYNNKIFRLMHFPSQNDMFQAMSQLCAFPVHYMQEEIKCIEEEEEVKKAIEQEEEEKKIVEQQNEYLKEIEREEKKSIWMQLDEIHRKIAEERITRERLVREKASGELLGYSPSMENGKKSLIDDPCGFLCVLIFLFCLYAIMLHHIGMEWNHRIFIPM